MEAFMAVYAVALAAAMKSHPNDYRYGETEVPEVLVRMRGAIERGSFNKNSHAFRATCKKLGINHTYKAIAHFIANHE